MSVDQPPFFLVILDLVERTSKIASFTDEREVSRALAAAEDARGVRPLESEVVLVQAEDLDAVQANHGHLFASAAETGTDSAAPMLLTELLPDV